MRTLCGEYFSLGIIASVDRSIDAFNRGLRDTSTKNSKEQFVTTQPTKPVHQVSFKFHVGSKGEDQVKF